MAPIPEYPGIRPTNISTYCLDFGDHQGKDPDTYRPISLPTPSLKMPQFGVRPGRKMKDQSLREEVRGVVNDYLTSLIAERSRPGHGHGMAVSAQDLMVASRSVGQRASKAEVDRILERFTTKPVIVVKPPSSNGGSRKNNVGSVRAKSVPIVNGPNAAGRSKKDYHWLVWKTTPTPVQAPPPDSAPVPVTPAPPITPAARPGSSRARSVLSRLDTPGTPYPDFPPSVDPGCTTGRAYTPAPPTPAPAPLTPAPYRVATPMSLRPDHHDNMASPQTFPKAAARGATVGGDNNGQPTFVPALNAWVANASDEEKNVAFDLLKTLNVGMNPLKIPKVKSKVKARAASAASTRPPPGGPTQLYRMPAAGVRTSAPGGKAYLDRGIEDQYVKLMAKSLQTTGPSEYQYTGQATTSRPWPTHLARAVAPIDYTHESSLFQNSMPTYRSHFTIHPEWVSETAAGQRNLKLLMCTKGPNGIRYMAQRT